MRMVQHWHSLPREAMGSVPEGLHSYRRKVPEQLALAFVLALFGNGYRTREILLMTLPTAFISGLQYATQDQQGIFRTANIICNSFCERGTFQQSLLWWSLPYLISGPGVYRCERGAFQFQLKALLSKLQAFSYFGCPDNFLILYLQQNHSVS